VRSVGSAPSKGFDCKKSLITVAWDHTSSSSVPSIVGGISVRTIVMDFSVSRERPEFCALISGDARGINVKRKI